VRHYAWLLLTFYKCLVRGATKTDLSYLHRSNEKLCAISYQFLGPQAEISDVAPVEETRELSPEQSTAGESGKDL
jgi:hypothetical protein